MGPKSRRIFALNPWAKNFVSSRKVLLYTEEFALIYPSGKRQVIYSQEVFGTPIKREERARSVKDQAQRVRKLCKYTFPDGRVYFEAVQDRRDGWGFLILIEENGKVVPLSLWCSSNGCSKPASIVVDINRPLCLIHGLPKPKREQSCSKK